MASEDPSGFTRDIRGQAELPTTSRSLFRHAADPESAEFRDHLKRLVQIYWKPVYCVIRQGWRRSQTDAKDLTQDFFATVILEGTLSRTFSPERGSFRALLRAAITNFMRNVTRDSARQKRGGDILVLSLEETNEEEIEDHTSRTPEQVFDEAWTSVVMKQAMSLLEAKLLGDGKSSALEAFRRYDLDGEGRVLSYAELGETVGLTASQVMHALRHAREVFRNSVIEIISEYVQGPAEIATELRALLEE